MRCENKRLEARQDAERASLVSVQARLEVEIRRFQCRSDSIPPHNPESATKSIVFPWCHRRGPKSTASRHKKSPPAWLLSFSWHTRTASLSLFVDCSMTSEMEHDALAFQLADESRKSAAVATPKRTSSGPAWLAPCRRRDKPLIPFPFLLLQRNQL